MLKVLLPKDIDWSKVDIWSQDETRIGPQGSLSRIWAKRGSRPRKVRQQQFIVNSGEVGDVVTSRRLPTITN